MLNKAAARGPEPPELPAALDGWRWHVANVRATTFGEISPHYLLEAPDGWRTKLYQKPEKAIAEAKRRVLSEPKPRPAAPAAPTEAELDDAGEIFRRAGWVEMEPETPGQVCWGKEHAGEHWRIDFSPAEFVDGAAELAINPDFAPEDLSARLERPDLVEPAQPPAPSREPWPQLQEPYFFGFHRQNTSGTLAHIWRPAPTARTKQRAVSSCGMAMQHDAPTPVAADAQGVVLCHQCRRAHLAPPPAAIATPAPVVATPAVVSHDGWMRIGEKTSRAHYWLHDGEKIDGYRKAACGNKTEWKLTPHLGHSFCRACEVWIEARAAQPTALDIPAEAVEEVPTLPGLLSSGLQDRARRYVAARQRSGEALLEAVAELAAARGEARHGEWGVFLEAIGLDDSAAVVQLQIAERAAADALFAERIRTGFLNLSTARELLTAPEEVQHQVLAQPAPPTRQEIRDAKRAANPAPAQDLPPPAPADALDLVLVDYQPRAAALGLVLRKLDTGDYELSGPSLDAGLFYGRKGLDDWLTAREREAKVGQAGLTLSVPAEPTPADLVRAIGQHGWDHIPPTRQRGSTTYYTFRLGSTDQFSDVAEAELPFWLSDLTTSAQNCAARARAQFPTLETSTDARRLEGAEREARAAIRQITDVGLRDQVARELADIGQRRRDARAAGATRPEPVIRVHDPALFEVAQKAYSVQEGWLRNGKIKKPFAHAGKLWIMVGGSYGGLNSVDDECTCVRVVEEGEPWEPGEGRFFREGAYIGNKAVQGGKTYVLTGQWLIVARPNPRYQPPQAPPALPAPGETVAQAIEANRENPAWQAGNSPFDRLIWGLVELQSEDDEIPPADQPRALHLARQLVAHLEVASGHDHDYRVAPVYRRLLELEGVRAPFGSVQLGDLEEVERLLSELAGDLDDVSYEDLANRLREVQSRGKAAA
jgi:hypothetical protein